jgi:flagellin-like protein
VTQTGRFRCLESANWVQPMKPHTVFNTDDRAVSPVIGVILMVAITVILAAVIGTFVLGLGDSLGDSQPSAQIDIDTSADEISLEHSGGDAVPQGDLQIEVTNVSATGSVDQSYSDEFSSRFTVGDTATLPINTDTASDTATLRVQIIHTPSDSILFDREVDIAEFDGIATGGWNVS